MNQKFRKQYSANKPTVALVACKRLVLGFSKSLTLIAFCCVALFGSVVGAQGPENTVVVVNADSADSLAVANAYIELRDIPSANVVYIKNVPQDAASSQSTSAEKFERWILKPVLTALSDRRIENQIDCITYSAGFPTRVNVKPQIDVHLRRTGSKFSKPLHLPWASITSATYFHRNVFGRDPDFFKLDANNFANPRKMTVAANPFSGKDSSQFSTAIKEMNAGDYASAIERLLELARTHREQVSVVYVLARCFALQGENEKAITSLRHAKEIGFAWKSILLADRAFSQLKNSPSFQEITESMEDVSSNVSPSRSFSASQYWAKNGSANGNAKQGERYVLSSVLAIVDKNASTLEESLARLRSSAAANATVSDGNVYFADHVDVRSKTRKGQFASAKQELESLGRTATIGPSIYPKGDPRVIGVTLGTGKFDWNQSGSQFLPGAICDNLTSFGGFWGYEKQTQLSEFLDAGAAGASGTVCEPFAIAAKFPSARWHAHYARGCTLAESFFQSVAGPSQILLAGDPLCCPFGRFPDFQIRGIEDGSNITGDFVLQVVPSPESPKTARYEIFYDGVFLGVVPGSGKVDVATDGMNDGYHELRIVAVSDAPIANKRSKKVGFMFNRDGHEVVLEIEKTRCQLDADLSIRVVQSGKGEIQIHQNLRPVVLTEKDSATIPAARLGLGVSKLQAVMVLEDGTLVRSKPVLIEVL